jgi:hypothetical protein
MDFLRLLVSIKKSLLQLSFSYLVYVTGYKGVTEKDKSSYQFSLTELPFPFCQAVVLLLVQG